MASTSGGATPWAPGAGSATGWPAMAPIRAPISSGSRGARRPTARTRTPCGARGGPRRTTSSRRSTTRPTCSGAGTGGCRRGGNWRTSPAGATGPGRPRTTSADTSSAAGATTPPRASSSPPPAPASRRSGGGRVRRASSGRASRAWTRPRRISRGASSSACARSVRRNQTSWPSRWTAAGSGAWGGPCVRSVASPPCRRGPRRPRPAPKTATAPLRRPRRTGARASGSGRAARSGPTATSGRTSRGDRASISGGATPSDTSARTISAWRATAPARA